MADKKEYEWEVTYQGKTVDVDATDKIGAAVKAAHKLGVKFSKTAKDFEIVKIGKAIRTEEAKP